MMLVHDGNFISPEVEVSLMLHGLQKAYGKRTLKKVLKTFHVSKIEDFYTEEKFFIFSDFYKAVQADCLKKLKYKNAERGIPDFKPFWIKGE